MKKSSSYLYCAAFAVAAMLSACKPGAPAETASASPTPAAGTPAATTPAASSTTPAVTSGTAGGNNLGLKDPVAVVNGEPITIADLNESFERIAMANNFNPADIPQEQKIEFYRQVLDELIYSKLLAKAAQGTVVPQEKIDAQIAKLKSQFPSEDAFNARLKEIGESPEKLKEALTKELIQQAWLESKLAGQTEVTEADARKFYDENKDSADFKVPDMVRASHILFLVKKDAPDDEVKKQLEAAKKAQARAKKEDFAKLAKELSQDPSAKESGGDLDFFSKEEMVPEFANAAFSQKVGVVSDPVRTDYGFHIIKVTDKKPAHALTFDEAKDRLMAYLKTVKSRKAMQDLLKSLRDDAKIENNLPAPAAPAMIPGMPGMPGAPGEPGVSSQPAAPPVPADTDKSPSGN